MSGGNWCQTGEAHLSRAVLGCTVLSGVQTLGLWQAILALARLIYELWQSFANAGCDGPAGSRAAGPDAANHFLQKLIADLLSVNWLSDIRTEQ